MVDCTTDSNLASTQQRNSGSDQMKGTDIAFATRPVKSNQAGPGGQVVQLFSNNYRLRLGGDKDGVIYKYAITYEPDVPDNSKVGRKLTSLAKDTLKAKFE